MSGPLEGTVRALTDDPLSVGRDAANQVVIGAVSRKHCTISQVSQGIFEISDLDSHNGTFVNGIQVSHTPIRHGDRIRIGISEFVFLIGEDNDASPQSSGVGKQTTSGTLTALFLDQRSGLLSDTSGIGRMARDLSAFFKIANLVNSFHDVEALQRHAGADFRERCAVFTTASTAPTPSEHVLCVPLVAVDNILSVIYLTSPAT